MISEKDIYIIFRKCQSNFLNRPYRLPKNWDAFFEKMQKNNKENLIIVTKWFNTKWKDIDIEQFFNCGFELFKNNFSYMKFFDKRIINLYIIKDKNKKRNNENIRRKIKNSINFIEEYMNGEIFTVLDEYCKINNDKNKIIFTHYILNKIDNWFMSLLINNGYIQLNEIDKTKIPYVINGIKSYLYDLKQIYGTNKLDKIIKREISNE